MKSWGSGRNGQAAAKKGRRQRPKVTPSGKPLSLSNRPGTPTRESCFVRKTADWKRSLLLVAN